MSQNTRSADANRKISSKNRDHEDIATKKLALESEDARGPTVSAKSKNGAPKGVGSKSCSAIWVTEPSKAKLLKLSPRFECDDILAAVQAKLSVDLVVVADAAKPQDLALVGDGDSELFLKDGGDPEENPLKGPGDGAGLVCGCGKKKSV